MDDQLTEREFWLNYWRGKDNLIHNIPRKNYLKPLFDILLLSFPFIKTCIEIGGFPGDLSVYLKKFYSLEPTLFDYVIIPEIINEQLRTNKLGEKDIGIIEADLFSYRPDKKFDLCLSYGFIEHFSNTSLLIQKHIDFLKEKGVVFIVVPNFLGMNGWLNKHFDSVVYEKHYLGCMDKKQLKTEAEKCQLQNIQTFYYGKFSIWITGLKTKNVFFRIFFHLLRFLGKGISTLLPFESRWFSPYTVLIAQKK